MIEIKESGMLFEFNDNQVFQIETSELHHGVGEGIKTVEFVVRLKEDELDFVEAKSSSPKPVKGNNEKFEGFICDITDKFTHSFDLYISAILKRNDRSEIHKEFFEIDSSNVKFKFILIIKGHKIEWLQPLSEALNLSMIHHTKIWKSKVVLMNEELAKKYKLVKE